LPEGVPAGSVGSVGPLRVITPRAPRRAAAPARARALNNILLWARVRGRRSGSNARSR